LSSFERSLLKKNENELSPLDVVIGKLHNLDSNILFKNNQLLELIKLNRNINTVDKNKQTVLHHLINYVDPKTIDQDQLKKFVDTIMDLHSLMSERALNLSDNNGVSALQLAANCIVPEVYWAAMGMGLPNYETPYFKSNYSSTFKDCRSSETFLSFAKSAWNIEIPSASLIPSANNDENSQELAGGLGYSEIFLFC